MKRFLTALNDRLSGYYILIAILVIWQIAPSLGWTNPTYIPPPSTILTKSEVSLLTVATHILVSFRRVLAGFLVCAAVGLPLAFLLGGAAPKAAAALRALMQFLSQIPPYILYPVVALFIGVGERAIIIIVFWSGMWPLLFSTIQGIQDIDPSLIRAARAMGARPLFLFFKVVVPGVFPNLTRGVRLGMTNCFLILIGAETMGGKEGIGWFISNSSRMAKINRVYLGAFLVAALGVALNWAMVKLEKNVVKWKRVPDEDLSV
ncbi:MAG: ABC transporter permease [Oscillospiraceae bacterium]|jgi:NitT/TauT family transport system permease protein|nr:ABC transporter permease [Oscillospiraceae bacterium]